MAHHRSSAYRHFTSASHVLLFVFRAVCMVRTMLRVVGVLASCSRQPHVRQGRLAPPAAATSTTTHNSASARAPRASVRHALTCVLPLFLSSLASRQQMRDWKSMNAATRFVTISISTAASISASAIALRWVPYQIHLPQFHFSQCVLVVRVRTT